MKKIAFIFIFVFISISLFAQSNAKRYHQFKSVITAPNGSVAITIIDDIKANTLKLESVDNFYKYQLIDIKSGEAVFSSSNKGKVCDIDKSKIIPGTYYLRFFTRDFIITSKIELAPLGFIRDDEVIAANE